MITQIYKLSFHVKMFHWLWYAGHSCSVQIILSSVDLLIRWVTFEAEAISSHTGY